MATHLKYHSRLPSAQLKRLWICVKDLTTRFATVMEALEEAAQPLTQEHRGSRAKAVYADEEAFADLIL